MVACVFPMKYCSNASAVDMNQFVETVATILKVPRDPGLFS